MSKRAAEDHEDEAKKTKKLIYFSFGILFKKMTDLNIVGKRLKRMRKVTVTRT
jgi:hypothetical protein